MPPILRRLLAVGPALFAVLTLPLVALAGLFLGGEVAAVIAVVGWLLLTPLSAIINEEVLDGTDDGELADGHLADEQSEAELESSDPLDRLRERYAEGEIDEAEFEHRLDLLLETEAADPETARDRVRELERERN